MNNQDYCRCSGETLAMASFPLQKWCEPYQWNTALANGTVFPCLNMEFYLSEKFPCPVCDNPNASEQEKKLYEISVVSFAINDLTLYLDTHPKCENGLKHFKELMKIRTELLNDYAKKFNPLTQFSMQTGTPDAEIYGWAEGPMPWEGGHV